MKTFGALLLLFVLFSALLGAADISEAKKLKYAEQTPENVERFRTVLETLAAEENAQALMMLGEAYQSGSHWEIDEKKALGYYERAAKLGDASAAERAALILENSGEDDRAKAYYETAFEKGRRQAVKPLLAIALKQQDAAGVKKYAAMAKQYDIRLEPELVAKIEMFEKEDTDIGLTALMDDMGDASFDATAVYVKAVMKTLISLEGGFKNLGYDASEYFVYEGVEPTIEIHLERDPARKVDEEMAFYIAGDNALKKAILRTMVWANRMSAFLEKELGYTVSGMEIEVGSSAAAKLIMKKMQ